MSTTRQITVDANNLVSTLYPRLRRCLKEAAPFLDEHFGDRLADQSLRHVLHSVTTSRSRGDFPNNLPKGDALFLARQMMDVGFSGLGDIGTNTVVVEMLDVAQGLALNQVRSYEIRNDVVITGQTP